jgi:hypothetical protein
MKGKMEHLPNTCLQLLPWPNIHGNSLLGIKHLVVSHSLPRLFPFTILECLTIAFPRGPGIRHPRILPEPQLNRTLRGTLTDAIIYRLRDQPGLEAFDGRSEVYARGQSRGPLVGEAAAPVLVLRGPGETKGHLVRRYSVMHTGYAQLEGEFAASILFCSPRNLSL